MQLLTRKLKNVARVMLQKPDDPIVLVSFTLIPAGHGTSWKGQDRRMRIGFYLPMLNACSMNLVMSVKRLENVEGH